jgi:hypothetical protein
MYHAFDVFQPAVQECPAYQLNLVSLIQCDDAIGDWTTNMQVTITILTFIIAGATLWVAYLTYGVSRSVRELEERYAQSRDRATTVWHMVDNAMRRGYELQDAGGSLDEAWDWINRFGVFSYHALGYHAYRVVFWRYPSKDQLAQALKDGTLVRNAIQDVLNGVYMHNFDKVADGKIRREFDVTLWHDWTPATPIPHGVENVAPPVPGSGV